MDIRVYIIIDSNYICGILPYYKSFTIEKLIRPNLSNINQNSVTLLECEIFFRMLLNKIPGAQRHHIFIDRYYTRSFS